MRVHKNINTTVADYLQSDYLPVFLVGTVESSTGHSSTSSSDRVPSSGACLLSGNAQYKVVKQELFRITVHSLCV